MFLMSEEAASDTDEGNIREIEIEKLPLMYMHHCGDSHARRERNPRSLDLHHCVQGPQLEQKIPEKQE